ncbi:GNAT family N-acetyltransferase [Amycolatopsis alba]|uniref:N-acetyltransferase n=1 Tax=Amycolatopsis alba DSM 44262 TaxID=1125972 RepID=A0A229S8L2_AMYAL|nr:GNAT family N-acetyltransferase [Amycolatopsis alba]OXM54924.1 N-acetyltransferase [Amycolatopsis alba DSM 44262]
MSVLLVPLSRDNVRAVCELRLADDQHHLVAPAAYTVAEGNYEPDAILRAIHLDETPVGVLLVEVENGTPHLVRFMIDANHQGRGIGSRAVELLIDELRADGWETLETSVVPVTGGADGFWRRCGFHGTDRTHHGEPVFVRPLRP